MDLSLKLVLIGLLIWFIGANFPAITWEQQTMEYWIINFFVFEMVATISIALAWLFVQL